MFNLIRIWFFGYYINVTLLNPATHTIRYWIINFSKNVTTTLTFLGIQFIFAKSHRGLEKQAQLYDTKGLGIVLFWSREDY